MNTISFMTANYVARQVGYNMTGGWGQGDRTTSEYFQPVATFGERFEEYLNDVRALGFETLDMWTGIMGPTWATEEHIDIAVDMLKKHNLPVVSMAGWFGSTPEQFEASCELAVALDTEILGGSTGILADHRAYVVDTLKKYGLKLGIENHPEKTPEELLEKIGDGGDGTIGATVDTGWFGTQGYDAAQAIEKLDGYLFHIHLKDVLAVGEHETCRFGRGVVPVEACVQTLKRLGYTGPISIEHEPELYDPTEDVAASFAMLREWLSA